jgi:hypothetical protein
VRGCFTLEGSGHSARWRYWEGFQTFPRWSAPSKARRLPTIVMETLGGFPNLPAMVRAEQSSAAPHAFD